MNKHTMTAPAPQKQLGCLIILCLLAATMLLLHSCMKYYHKGERIEVSRKTAVERLVFTDPNVLDKFAIPAESPIEGSILNGNFIAFTVVEVYGAVARNAAAAGTIERLAAPLIFLDEAGTRTTIINTPGNELLYFVWRTAVHLLFVPAGATKNQ